MILRTVLLASIVTLVLAGPARAQTDALSAAESAMDEGDFERASDLLLSIARDGTRVPADVAHAYELLGVLRATLGEDAGARQAFDWALALDPGMPTPAELGPAQRAMLDQLRAARHGHGLELTVDAPSAAAAADATTITATVAGAPDGASVTVTVTAWPDDDESAAITADGGGAAHLTIPAGAWPAASEIHVHAEVRAEGPALAHREARVARTGAATTTTPALGGGGGEVWQEAWFWVVIGVVVVGAGVGVGLGVGLPHDVTLGPPQLVMP